LEFHHDSFLEKAMTDSIEYQAGLWKELANYLQGMWKEFTSRLTALRTEDAFIDDAGLRPFLPIYSGIGTSALPSTASPFAASGALVFDPQTTGA
jgi:hypothetical protein